MIDADEVAPGALLAAPTPGRAPGSRAAVMEFLRADFALNHGAARITIALYRLAQWLERTRSDRRLMLLRKCVTALSRSWAVVSHVELPSSSECGPGLRLAHGGYGLVLHANVSIGARATLYQGVTMGMRGDSHRVPRLGDDVHVFANAVLAGPIEVGDRCRVGANVVLATSLPADASVSAPQPVLRLRS